MEKEEIRKWAYNLIVSHALTQSALEAVLNAVYLEGKINGILSKPEEK